MLRLKTSFTSLALAGSLLAMSGQSVADNCYIMVHGHGLQGDQKILNGEQPAREYWRDAEFDDYQGSDFIEQLLSGNDNYGLVGYDSTDESEYPYWHDNTAGEVARQIIEIKKGNGDGYTHDESVDTQCAASDDFYVVSHSQGAAEMMYISGNAVSGSPYYNRAYAQMDTTNSNQAGLSSSNEVVVDFDSAMDSIVAIFTIGGAITGTEGADRVCDGNWLDGIINAAFLGKTCGGVRTMQTNDVYTVRNYIGTTLGAPVYTFGGYKTFPGYSSASSAFLGGEDDGYINLASQMSCEGSATRNLYSDLSTYKTFFGVAYGSPKFTCDDDHKGTPRTYNMASVHTDHDAERNGGLNSPSYTSIDDGRNCGAGENVAGRINACN